MHLPMAVRKRPRNSLTLIYSAEMLLIVETACFTKLENKPTFKYDLHKENKLLSNTSHKNSNKNVTRKKVIKNQIYLISRDEKGKIVNFGTEVVNKDSFLYIVEMKCY